LTAIGATDLTTATDVVPTTNVATADWDETAWSNSLESSIVLLKTSADLPASGQKVNAGSFKGYVALYALGYEGQRMSAKVGNDWVIVPRAFQLQLTVSTVRLSS